LPIRHSTKAITLIQLGALTLFVGCVGDVIGDPEVEVAQLQLTGDGVGGLVLDECVEPAGGQACATYPNPKGCDDLLVSVRGDGSTIGHCDVKGVTNIIRSIAEGVPITCQVDYHQGCVRCVDVYGGFAVGTCDESADLPDNESSPPGSADTEPFSTPPTTPQTAEEASCTHTAQQGFVDRLNNLLQDEGLTIKYEPDLSKLKPIGGVVTAAVCSGLGLAGNENKPVLPTPVTLTPVDPFFKECAPSAMLQGHCYCTQVPLIGSLCRCGRFMGALLAEACGARPPECDATQWARAIFPVFGGATMWLNAYFVAITKGPGDVVCLDSPLVLDLNNDGVQLSPVSAGVTFDLTGAGPLRTAWVRGTDDALLAIDRDGSGTIDSGAELFGEGTPLEGRRAADGFEALAALDRPERGGNGNGLVEQGDLMFEQLVLWRDADHNGRSEAGELVSLESAGVIGLEVAGSAPTSIIDPHGNDLSLRARYLRADGGSGLLVDAFFVTSAP
jgi:hypothetical protein